MVPFYAEVFFFEIESMFVDRDSVSSHNYESVELPNMGQLKHMGLIHAESYFSAHKSEQEKNEKRKNHASKETEFLRLKRTRLGKDDFEPLVVIGRGAFGEVRLSGQEFYCYCQIHS